jgi:hypothetical protein
MSPQVLAYNLKRVINILGIARTLKAVSSMRAWAHLSPKWHLCVAATLQRTPLIDIRPLWLEIRFDIDPGTGR